MLRKHQKTFKEIISRIQTGSGIETIYCHVSPGGGKSILPIIAGRLIEARLADKLIWIAPRLSLIDQAEREFTNPYFRGVLNHRLLIRQSTNERNPSRGLQGFATTYNAVGIDEGDLVREFARHRYILICDEFHHIQEGSLWHQKIKPLFEAAAFRVMMSGTLERGDGTPIAFLPYGLNGGGLKPNLRTTDKIAVVTYSRAAALRERAIIPLSFHLTDCSASWETRRGRVVKVASIVTVSEIEASKALYTALYTEFAEDLLSVGLKHWQEHRQRIPGAKCLVVTSNIEQARRHTQNIKSMGPHGIRVDIATSESSPEALKAIKKMKAGKLDLLITVAMAYEGLDIPAISHIIALTRIRSTPWIEQMIARANRIDPDGGQYEGQCGFIFAPADPLFKEIVARIEREQLPFLRSGTAAEKNEETQKPREGFEDFKLTSPGGIVPISSTMTGKREVFLAAGQGEILCEPPSETEESLLDEIENHVRTYSFRNRYNPKRINAEIFGAFGKPRREMTIPELRRVLDHVKRAYSLERIRGTGFPRVGTKAANFNCEWRDRWNG